MVQHTIVLILHAGAATAMAWLSKRYYISKIQQLLKSISRNCTVCQKTYARTSTQMMADLPADRTTPSSPFSSVEIDYTGPFSYKEGNQRKPTIKKGYMAVYACFSTKAVFFDLVVDLTTDAFLASLRRFSSIYGVPAFVFSDNGFNFVGANAELVRLKKLLQGDSTLQSVHQYAHDHGCQWNFNPSRAPHFGGLWESAVKSMKILLLKSAGHKFLRYDELQTLLYEAAAILNSRPLAPIETHDPDGPLALTLSAFSHRLVSFFVTH